VGGAAASDQSASGWRVKQLREQVSRLIDALALPIGLALLALLVAWHAVSLRAYAQAGSHDFRILYEATSEFWTGRSLYAARTAHANLNPPHFHLLILPFTVLPQRAAFWIWTAANVIGLALSVAIIRRELVPSPSLVAWLWLANAALMFAGTAAALWTGQTALLLMWPATLAWRAARRGDWMRTGALIGVLMALKPFLGIFVPFWILARHRRALAGAVLAVSASFLVGVVVFGIAEHARWLQTLSAVDWAGEPWNASLLAPIARTTGDARAPVVKMVWLVAAALVALASLARALAFDRTGATDRALACLFVGALLASPLGWIHYLWWGAGPVAATLVQDRSRTIHGWRGIASTGALLGLLSPPFVLGLWAAHAWGRAVFGSAYFWGLLALWMLMMVAPPRAAS